MVSDRRRDWQRRKLAISRLSERTPGRITAARLAAFVNRATMTPVFFDTHAHLDDPVFAPDLPQVIGRAGAAGITRIISIGTDWESSASAVALTEKYPGVFAAVGWHPEQAMAAPEDVRDALRALARRPKVVAIGETGLDYYRLPTAEVAKPGEVEGIKRKQAALFRQQLDVAAELGLSCVIHERAAFEDTVAIMQEYVGRVRGVFHCFVGDPAAMRRVLALGSLVSFTGIATFKNAPTVRETLAAVPAGRFMLETDCPYLAPVPYRGKRCEPAHVVDIAAAAAQVRGCAVADLSAETCATAEAFFPKLTGS